MHNEARVRAYQAAVQDPYAFLAKHFDLYPESPVEVIRTRFTEFARGTGAGSNAADAAVEKFRARTEVAPFILQVASSKVQECY